ncbi:uncharacterized protein LOC116194568 [Punica granatum]|uniref:Uncharacterized protein LOC116194568 n=1 Tax=Punica granatum TaxID=22663 RepID=A0A6P8CEI6_PUNGR|nr:uncharacterized protein LOC116194568 [Punica granatum]
MFPSATVLHRVLHIPRLNLHNPHLFKLHNRHMMLHLPKEWEYDYLLKEIQKEKVRSRRLSLIGLEKGGSQEAEQEIEGSQSSLESRKKKEVEWRSLSLRGQKMWFSRC